METKDLQFPVSLFFDTDSYLFNSNFVRNSRPFWAKLWFHNYLLINSLFNEFYEEGTKTENSCNNNNLIDLSFVFVTTWTSTNGGSGTTGGGGSYWCHERE